nr:MAG TPA: hypothetical protein [Caudoviricetes sp.]
MNGRFFQVFAGHVEGCFTCLALVTRFYCGFVSIVVAGYVLFTEDSLFMS